jgi:hypothetical protein
MLANTGNPYMETLFLVKDCAILMKFRSQFLHYLKNITHCERECSRSCVSTYDEVADSLKLIFS